MLIRYCLYFTFLGCTLGPQLSAADNQSDSTGQKTGFVEVEMDPLADTKVSENYSLPPYRDRRSPRSLMVTLQRQAYLPSTLEIGNTSYAALFNTDPLLAVEFLVSKKWNFSWLSWALAGKFSSGHVASGATSLALKQVQVGTQIYFDTLFKEPYLVPFAELSYGSSTVELTHSGSQTNLTLSPMLSYSFGLMLQLNALNPDTAVVAYYQHHLENTYLTVGVNSTTLANPGDLTFESSQQVYMGLTLEM